MRKGVVVAMLAVVGGLLSWTWAAAPPGVVTETPLAWVMSGENDRFTKLVERVRLRQTHVETLWMWDMGAFMTRSSPSA